MPTTSWSPGTNRRSRAEPTLPLAPVTTIRNGTSEVRRRLLHEVPTRTVFTRGDSTLSGEMDQLSRDARPLQRGPRAFRQARGKLNQRMVPADVDVTEILPVETALVSDRAHDLARFNLVPLSHVDAVRRHRRRRPSTTRLSVASLSHAVTVLAAHLLGLLAALRGTAVVERPRWLGLHQQGPIVLGQHRQRCR